MKLARLAGLLLLAVLAMGLLSAATASAAESSNPLFLSSSGNPVSAKVTGLSGPSTLKTSIGQAISCQKDVASGEITSTLLIGNVFVHYLECTIITPEGGATRCTIKSVGVAGENEGLILTKTLHGILGLILSPAPLDTGILFLPGTGSVFVELAEAKNGTVKCAPLTKVTGKVAALITPVAVHSFTGLLVFPEESIKKIDLTHGIGVVEPELVAYTFTASLSQHDFLEWSASIGVT